MESVRKDVKRPQSHPGYPGQPLMVDVSAASQYVLKIDILIVPGICVTERGIHRITLPGELFVWII
jgi:hypothetical protein